MLPYALGAAVSPVLLTVEVFILAGKNKPKLHAWIYTAGVATVAVLLIALFATVLHNIDQSDGSPSPLGRGIKIAIALVLAILAVRAFLPATDAEAAGQSSKTGRLNQWISRGRLRSYYFTGLVMMATNLSSIVIMIPGIHHVQESELGLSADLVAYAVLLLFVMLPALIPVGLLTLFGAKADGILLKLNAYVSKHSRTITGVICALLAIYLFIGAVR